MPNEDNKKLKCNHRYKSLKAPFITHADLEYLHEKMIKKISLMKSKKFITYAKKEFSTDDDNEVALKKKYPNVRDHCHYTEKFRGARHDICNLR